VSSDQESDRPEVYRIKVQGRLGETWSRWFDDMAVTFEEAGDGSTLTTLTGPVVDQVALRSILDKIWNLNLTLIHVSRIETGGRNQTIDTEVSDDA
jgi:hypothetical protein